MQGLSVIIQDNFYADPFHVRAHALLSTFDVKGNYPGYRTAPFVTNDIYNAIQQLVQSPICYWPTDQYNGSFQYTLSTDRTWIHADYTTNWAGVLYLTPEAPVGAGTAFYRHKKTGQYECPQDKAMLDEFNKDASSYDEWERTDHVANIFNRLILFNANRFHASASSFGDKKENGRLFQTFFFTTQ